MNLVFLPCLLGNKDIFSYHKNLLEQKYKTLNIHIPVFTNITTIQEASNLVIQQMKGEQFIIAGISMGGYIAMDILRNYPQYIQKACFINTFWDVDSPVKIEERLNSIKNAEAIDDSSFTGINNETLSLFLYNKRQEDINIIKAMAKNMGRKTFINQQKLILSRKSSVQDFSLYNFPVLCIAGDNDKITPSSIMQKMANSCKGKFVSIPNCGHLSLLDQKEATYSLLDYWLQ